MRKEGVEIETKTSQLNETRTKQKNQAHRSSERTSAFLRKNLKESHGRALQQQHQRALLANSIILIFITKT